LEWPPRRIDYGVLDLFAVRFVDGLIEAGEHVNSGSTRNVSLTTQLNF
jgi:hypothetical protein